MITNYDRDMEMIGRELTVYGGDAASSSLKRLVGRRINDMTKEQTSKVLEIWTRIEETHDGSWSELAMKTIGEYLKPHHELSAAVSDGGSLRRMVQWLRRKCCRHQFALCDQQLTGIQEQERPAPNASYAEWMQWYRNRDKDPAHTKRVSWPCVKCGEVFYAHCGLDILRHGTTQNSQMPGQ